MKARNKIIKSIIAVLLICCFFSMTALSVSAASGTKVNVITQIQWKFDNGAYTKKYTYNSKGLVTKQAVYDPDGNVCWFVKYTYGSNNLVKTAEYTEYGEKISKTTYTYNKKNQVTKRVRKPLQSGVKSIMTTAYAYDKSGNMIKQTMSFKNNDYIPETAKFVIKCTYNKKGLMTKKTVVNSPGGEGSKGTYTYKYDSNGFVKRSDYEVGYGTGYTTRKLTYKDGILKKYQDVTYEGGETTKDKPRTVKTKTVSVSGTVSDIVKKQQEGILNGDFTIDLYLGY